MSRFTSVFYRIAAALGGLQPTLLVFVALPLVLVAALATRVGFEQANQFQEAVLKSDIELIARAVRITVGEALAHHDKEAVETALQSVFTIDRVYGASVFDVEGRRVASGGFAETDLSNSTIPEQVLASAEKKESYRRVAGRTVFSHFLPVFDSFGRSTGFIQITRRPHDFTNALKHLTYAAWSLWAVFAVTIVGTVLIGHYRGIGRHVDRLLLAMSRAEKGELGLRLAADGPREVRALATGFNNMLSGIEQSERELERRGAEERDLMLQLKDSEKMAAIGRVTRGFAHELGAPLTVIDGRARRLEKGLEEGSNHQREAHEIRQQVKHLSSTVRGLLEYTRPVFPERQSIDIGALLQEARDVIAAERDASSPAVTLGGLPHLPTINGHPERLQLALLNLLRNATQAARSQVTLTALQTPEACAITIEDDGPGLPPGIDPKQLTEPFFTTKASGEGTGLGLAVSQSIIEDHGGSLSVENCESGGFRVRLILPVPATGTGGSNGQ